MATPREYLLAAGRRLAVRTKHYGELARSASTQASVDIFQALSDRIASASAVCFDEAKQLPAPPTAPPKASLADLAEQHADDKAQDPVRLSAEVRRLRARVAELESLLEADKPLPDPGAPTPEPHP